MNFSFTILLPTLRVALLAVLFSFPSIASATDGAGIPKEKMILPDPILLPAPRHLREPSLDAALSARRSCRSFQGRRLDRQLLADLLWATAGTNRPAGGRTAPSAYGKQAVDLYVVLEEGVFRYRSSGNALEPLLAGDFRKETGMQPFVGGAPVDLLFVADDTRLQVPASSKDLLLGVEAGAMSQNAALFCASAGLGSVVRAGIDGVAFGKLLELPAGKRILLAQTIGWPAE